MALTGMFFHTGTGMVFHTEGLFFFLYPFDGVFKFSAGFPQFVAYGRPNLFGPFQNEQKKGSSPHFLPMQIPAAPLPFIGLARFSGRPYRSIIFEFLPTVVY